MGTTTADVPWAARIPAGGSGLATAKVTAVIRELVAPEATKTYANWLGAVARLVSDMRPDLARGLVEHLGVEPSVDSPLRGMSMGEVGVVYEALHALADHTSRRENGQYFTPDDVAAFMASQAHRFPEGIWLDPCCGVGNLSFHLANAMADPADFVRNRLVLIDRDSLALRTACALLAANFAAEGDEGALASLRSRAVERDFLGDDPLPPHDYAIVNPPYARTERDSRFRTGAAGELYAYFLERIADTSAGFIAITPASYLSGVKYQPLRDILEARAGGDALVFDNVPDTCFRGFKYGSTNTSKTNFVRAAITVSAPGDDEWHVSPILRWAARSRARMFRGARAMLVPLRMGPAGEWAKISRGTEAVWGALADSPERLGDLLTRDHTEFRLDVASTPRYYISASRRLLDRGSKHVLYFRSRRDLDRAYLLLNSTLPYWWWRSLDGGITLPRRTLLSLPVPGGIDPDPRILDELLASEEASVVTKLNAGRRNENIRRSRELVDRIDDVVFGEIERDFAPLYAPDMFAAE